MRQKNVEWENWGNYIWLLLLEEGEFWLDKQNLPFVTATMNLLFFSKHTKGVTFVLSDCLLNNKIS